MKLTGNCKEEFGIWHFERNTPIEEYKNFHLLSETCKNALIIEFFDSLGITIDRDSYDKKMTITDWRDGLEKQTIIDCDYLEPFQEWWEEAITKANEIFNLKNK